MEQDKAIEKLDDLKAALRDMGSLLVAFSGGVDSTFLLRTAKDALGDGVVALTATSPTYPERELVEARSLARDMGVSHIVVESNELEIPNFAENTDKRCYYCKAELFALCLREAERLGMAFVADGANADDRRDYRPGSSAARELGVRSPLAEVGLAKAEIRSLSRAMGLPTWEKPNLACLSSRFPYGTRITQERVRKIGECEDFLFSMGFRGFRVRYHGDIARIEAGPSDIGRLLDEATRGVVIKRFKEIGFTYVTVDIEGYRTGSMNEVILKKGRAAEPA